MKAFTLITSLQPAERKAVASVIKSTERKGLENLFNVLVKSAIKKTEPVKEDLFKATFGNAYSDKKDYLLRNELRLLSDIVCRYMAEQEMLAELYDNPPVYHNYLLKSWNRRKLLDLFHQNIEAWKNEANEQRYFNEAIEMHLLGLNRVMYDFEDNPQKLEKLIQLVNTCSEAIEKLFVYKWWSLESHHQTVHNYKNVAAGKNIPVAPRKPDAHAYDSFPEDDFVLAMKYETSIYAAKKDAYLSILQNAYKHCKKIMGNTGKGIDVTCSVNSIKFFSVLNERLMIILCSEGRVKEAEVYANELEKLIKESKLKFNYTLSYNISYYYYYSKQYEKVLAKADALLVELKENKRLYYQALGMKAYSHIFLGQFDAVRKCIPQEVQQINLDEYVQFRIAEMILWYYDETYDAALRECENIKRMLKGKSDEERKQTVIDFPELINNYKYFFEAVSSVDAEKKKKLQSVQMQMQSFTEKYPVVLHQTPALAWLNTILSH